MATLSWQKWGEATFEKAREQGKPLLIWVNHAGCRACRQMEEESFGDPEIVRLIEAGYVPIRIDRDERPDVDRHFQRVFTTLLGKEEGWPLTLFLDPDHIPLYAAAYVPPEARDGMMGFGSMLELIARKYAEDRPTLLAKGKEVLAQLAMPASLTATRLDRQALGTTLAHQFRDVYDEEHSGLGTAPKYLRTSTLEAALSWGEQEEEGTLLDRVSETLDTMLASGVWDEAEGGFYCCALDAAWQIPYRRKDLGENARMIVLLLRAGKILKNPGYTEVATRIADWARVQMQDHRTKLFHAGTLEESIDRRLFLAPNAMMVTALCQLAQQEDRFRADALGTLHAVMEYFQKGDDLVHQYTEETGVTFFEDYVWLAKAFLAAFDLTGNQQFSLSASTFVHAAIRRFYQHGFWRVGDGEFRDPAPFVDGEFSSPAGEMIGVLNRLSVEVDPGYKPFADQTLSVASYDLMRHPISQAKMAESALGILNGN